MQVHRSASGVARISCVADDVTRLNAIASAEHTIAIQVRVVVPLETRSEDPNRLASESVGPDVRDDASRSAQNRRVLRRDNVDALMLAATRPGVPSGINEPWPRRQRIRQQRVCWLFHRERVDEPRALNNWPRRPRTCRDHEQRHYRTHESFHSDVFSIGSGMTSREPSRTGASGPCQMPPNP